MILLSMMNDFFHQDEQFFPSKMALFAPDVSSWSFCVAVAWQKYLMLTLVIVALQFVEIYIIYKLNG
jgi:hypothetical protein